ncbi:MAG: histidinol phosphate phosphatase domain-containing protein [Asgard group archaeon]|nr:histidinol phosphate phosphatase domain-containing protein [Asgard group archaeon]
MKIFKESIEELLSQEQLGRCDFHTHSFFSDGVLLPIEQLRRAYVIGHIGYAITDHVSLSNLEIITQLTKDCILARNHWGIVALPGVEITHVPANAIEEVALKARELGACIVVVHGETIAEPVEEGTNLKAAHCKEVDILAHPGMMTKQVAEECKKNEVFVEITSNRTHRVTNGHVFQVGSVVDAKFIQNTDTHTPQDMLNYIQGKEVLIGAGCSEEKATSILQKDLHAFLTKIYNRL